MFIELPDFQKIVYWCGTPYMVESAFRGRFLHVMNIDETEIVYQDVIDLVLNKFEIFNRLKLL